jgi:RIP metalloprotease RseP
VHELGHFVVAKLVGIQVERFALGFGKRLVGFEYGQTDYCINLIPLGGYIKMLGQEDFAPLDEAQADPRAFNNKTVGQRFGVISAGVIMNVIFAAILFVIIGLVGIRFEAPVVGEVIPGAPADTVRIRWDGAVPVAETTWPKAVVPPAPGPGPTSRPATSTAAATAAPAATAPAVTAPVTTAPGTKVAGTRTVMATESTGFKPGDLLRSLDEKRITRFPQVKMTALLGEYDQDYYFVVEREVDGVTRVGHAVMQLKPTKSPSGSGSDVPAFGISSAHDLVFGIIHGADYDTPFQEGERIVAIDGKGVRHFWEADRIAQTRGGRPTVITVQRGGSRRDVTVQPTLFMKDWHALKDGTVLRGKQVADGEKDGERFYRILLVGGGQRRVSETKDLDKVLLDVLGLRPRMTAGVIVDRSAAQKAGLKPRDVIAGYSDCGPPDRQRLWELAEQNVGKKTSIIIERKGRRLAPMWIEPVRKGDEAINGFLPGVDMENLVVAAVRPGSPAAVGGVQGGDVIVRVDQAAVTGWADLYHQLKDRHGKPVVITCRRGQAVRTWTIDRLTDDLFFAEDYETNLLVGQRPLLELRGPLVKHGPLGALVWGVKETWMFTLTQYATFRSLFQGRVSTKEATGPLGIGKIAIDIGRRGVVDFLYFLAMISVALAVVNFLPIPVVDGGHAVFLILEKIRGKPLSLRVMNAVQVAGLLLLLFIFVYVTWNDVLRIFT